MNFLDLLRFWKPKFAKGTEKYRKKIGAYGEKAAAKYLWKNGYRILETNYRDEYGEIDIIAEEKDVVIFVEVKTRTSTDFGTPDEAVNKEKQRHIIRVSRSYIMQKKIKTRKIRYDIVSVVHNLETGKSDIELQRDAFC